MKARTRLGLLLFVPALAILAAKVFVADLYRVDSGSMKPTIHGAPVDGELVLVRYGRPDLRRHDLVVLQREGEREPIVKRVAGLGGEELRIQDGDLLIDGAKQGSDLPRPPLVEVFDSELHSIFECFELTGDSDGVDEDTIVFGGEPTQVCWRSGLNDDHLGPDGGRVLGRNPVGDGAIECELVLAPEPSRSGLLALSLSEEGDLFELRVERAEAELGLTIIRRGAGSGEARLAGARLPLGSGEGTAQDPLRLRFSNLDDVLTASVNGRRALEFAYRGNTPLVGAPDPKLRHRRPRVCVTAVGFEAEVRRLRILRDLHYTDYGDIGVLSPVSLGADELFLLGDHSGESVDGRSFGPVGLDEVLGVPVAVVWPLSRARWLLATEPPQPPVGFP